MKALDYSYIGSIVTLAYIKIIDTISLVEVNQYMQLAVAGVAILLGLTKWYYQLKNKGDKK